MRALLAAVIISLPTSAFAVLGPDNYWECILDRVAKATTDQEANAIRRGCRTDFPDYYWRVSIPKQDGLLVPTVAECIKDETKNVTNKRAQELIVEACRALYYVE